MSVLIIIVLICCIISLKSKITKEKEENQKLKKQINAMKEFIKKYIPEGEIPLEQKMMFNEKIITNVNKKETSDKKIANHTEIENQKLSIEDDKKIIENNKKKINSYTSKNIKVEDSRNVIILITGAILIVLAAIVFLMTTWYTIPNILKTLVLVCLIGVFLGASNIAKNKFKLEKASLTFFFMAMAYIPICLYSISIFELLGEYLSIYGDGKFIYFTLSTIFVSIIYFVYYKSTKNNILLYGSILAQELTVILFTCVLKVDFNIILINLSLYNLLLMLITNESKENVLKKVCEVMPFVILGLNLLTYDIINEFIELRLLILAVNFLILEIKYSKIEYAYIFNILYVLASTIFISNIEILSDFAMEIIMLVNVIVTYFVENLLIMGRKKINLQNSSLVITLISIMILQTELVIIKPYFTSILVILFAMIAYRKFKDTGKSITAIVIPIYFIIAGLTFFDDLELSYHYQIIFSIICLVLSEFITGKEMEILKKSCFAIFHIFIAVVFLCCFFTENNAFANDVLYFGILMLIYVYSFFKYQNLRIFKYLAYFTSNLVLVSGFNFFDISSDEGIKLIPLITTTGIMLLENKYKDLKLKDDFSRTYLAISKIVVFALIADMGTLGAVLSITFAGVSIYNNIINKQSQFLDIIPLIGILPAISNYDIDENVRLLITIFVTIAATSVSIYKTKFSVYTLFSIGYLGYLSDYINNEYCTQILCILWALLHCVFEKNVKFKDIYKAIFYIVTTEFYYKIISYIELDKYVLFNILGILVLAVLILKNIVRKHLKAKDIEVIEYIVYAIIYLYAMSSYANLTDAMLFLILVIGFIIYSYLSKYGTLFIVNIIVILVNVFYLTKEFWLTIPWWLYLLVIGSILISFAIRNEAKENEEKISLGSIINKIKDNIEK